MNFFRFFSSRNKEQVIGWQTVPLPSCERGLSEYCSTDPVKHLLQLGHGFCLEVETSYPLGRVLCHWRIIQIDYDFYDMPWIRGFGSVESEAPFHSWTDKRIVETTIDSAKKKVEAAWFQSTTCDGIWVLPHRLSPGFRPGEYKLKTSTCQPEDLLSIYFYPSKIRTKASRTGRKKV